MHIYLHMRYSAIMLLLIIYSLLLTTTTGFHTPTSSNLYNIKGIKHTQTSRINTELNSLPVVEFLSHFDFDQFIQNALNTATNTAPQATQTVDLSVAMNEAKQLDPLGNDLLIFLCATIFIVPFFNALDSSPVLGFLSAGLLMGPAGLGLFKDMSDLESLADFGVLFLLFEQGLELTIERLRSLAKYAFGMGTLQVLLCTGAFFLFPFLGGVQFLEFIARATPDVVDITRVDEALVIGAALSLSSSAFVLKILQESGKMNSKVGSASLGILLLQDIAVVPLLVLLPIIESNSGPMPLSEQIVLVGDTVIKAIVGLGGILVVGGSIVRQLFSVVAKTKSTETFVALCLLVALGMGALTQSMGLSSTLGAFTAGTLLAESNYRTQIESDIQPFRGILLGLFFLTTGASVDPSVIGAQFPTVVALLTGLIAFKAIIIGLLGPRFDLTTGESVKLGLLLSGGGEFAFVVLSLAGKLGVLPDQLVKILIGVVVLSMALTPTLAQAGDVAQKYLEKKQLRAAQKEMENMYPSGSVSSGGSSGSSSGGSGSGGVDTYMELVEQEDVLYNNNDDSDGDEALTDVLVVCGFNMVSEAVVNSLRYDKDDDDEYSSSSSSSSGGMLGGDDEVVVDSMGMPQDTSLSLNYVAFDLDPDTVIKSFKAGYRVMYGDGTNPKVLTTAGIENPSGFVLTTNNLEDNLKSIEKLKLGYPGVPIFARGSDISAAFELINAGAESMLPDQLQIGLNLGQNVLNILGADDEDVDYDGGGDGGDDTIIESLSYGSSSSSSSSSSNSNYARSLMEAKVQEGFAERASNSKKSINRTGNKWAINESALKAKLESALASAKLRLGVDLDLYGSSGSGSSDENEILASPTILNTNLEVSIVSSGVGGVSGGSNSIEEINIATDDQLIDGINICKLPEKSPPPTTTTTNATTTKTTTEIIDINNDNSNSNKELIEGVDICAMPDSKLPKNTKKKE